MRRWILVLLLVAIVAATAWTLTGQYKPQGAPDPWRAIPTSAAVIIELSDPLGSWDRWTHTAQLWGSLSEIRSVVAIDALMGRLASRAEKNAALRNALESTTVLLALVPEGTNSVQVLITWPAADQRVLQALVEGIADAPAYPTTGLTLRSDTALPPLDLAWSGGVARMATSIPLLESSAIAMAEGTMDSALVAARATLGAGTDAHVLVHGRRLPQLLGTWFEAGTIDALEVPEGWSALDVRVRPEALLFSGVLFTSSDDHRLARLQEQGVGHFSPSRALPLEAGLVRSFNLHDPQRWIDDAGLVDDPIAHALFSWANGSVTLAHTSMDTGTVRTWVVVQGDDPIAIRRSLGTICPEKRCDTLEYRGQRMAHASVHGVFERMFGPSFAALEEPWYAVLADKAVFSDDADGLRASIDAWLDGTSLGEDLATVELIQRYGGNAASTIWCDAATSLPLVRTRAKDPGRFDRSPWRDLGGVLLQCTPGPTGRAFLSVSIQFAKKQRGAEQAGVLWMADLPAPVAHKPDLIRNVASGTRDVLVQDREHAIHVFSSGGQLLWSRTLDGPILGAVHQVDRYRNGKLQLLFNTAGRLYMIDRNGRDVEGFPIELKEEATAPLAVFDYDDKRDYRILLPTEEGRVLNIGIDGLLVDGWDAPRMSQTTEAAVRHFRIRGKDHLLAADRAGGLHVWDRRGAMRYKPKATLPGLRELVDVRPALEVAATLILWLDTAGVLNRTRLDGVTGTMGIPLRRIDHAVSGDLPTGPAIIASSGDSLVIVKDGGELLLGRSFGTPITAPPMLFDLGTGTAIGIVCGTSHELHFIEPDGEGTPGSPFDGNTAFSIADLDRDGEWELVAGDRKGRLVVRRLGEAAALP